MNRRTHSPILAALTGAALCLRALSAAQNTAAQNAVQAQAKNIAPDPAAY